MSSKTPTPPDLAARPAASFPTVLGADAQRCASYRASLPLDKGLSWGRIAEDRRTQYIVSMDPAGPHPEVVVECSPELLRDYRRGVGLRPVVGDWVVVEASLDASGEPRPSSVQSPWRVVEVLERRSYFTRKRPHQEEAQILAANVHRALLLSALGPDFNPRRIERYLAAAHEAGSEPVIVLGKLDLCPDPAPFVEALEPLRGQARVICWSSVTLEGLESLQAEIPAGCTAVLLGSSGVGKSTLINCLLGDERLRTSDVRRDGKGRHTTTTRQLLTLHSGGVVIDTPGIPEIALWEADQGVQETFPEVESAARECRFNDCRHAAEPGCAVQAALASGELDAGRVHGYIKLTQELEETAREAATRKRPPRHMRHRNPKKRR
jgi:ribosome biogenesis GTPase